MTMTRNVHDAIITSVCSLASFSLLPLPALSHSNHLLESALLPTQATKSRLLHSQRRGWRSGHNAPAVSVARPSARGGDRIERRRNLAQPFERLFLPTHDSSGRGPESCDARPSLPGHLQLPATRLNGKRFGFLSACS